MAVHIWHLQLWRADVGNSLQCMYDKRVVMELGSMKLHAWSLASCPNMGCDSTHFYEGVFTLYYPWYYYCLHNPYFAYSVSCLHCQYFI
jgi:hypothetical protein